MSPWKEDQAELEENVGVGDCERGFDELKREVSGELGVSASRTGIVGRGGKRAIWWAHGAIRLGYDTVMEGNDFW
jgi:hypothetical protein